MPDGEEWEKSIDNENEDVIHSNIKGNVTETTQYTPEEVIDEFQDYTSPIVMED